MRTPKSDGFYMPAEYSRHLGTIMIWPERAGSWIYGAAYARPVFAEIIKAIAEGETVYVAVSDNGEAGARQLLKEEIARGAVKLLNIPTDDSWARDTAPTFVTDGKEVRGVDWRFNAWGGEVNGLYKNFANDDKFASEICKKLNIYCYSARPFVLEGGSIHSNGRGTVITTEECLLSAGRNPELSKEEIERNLKEYLGADKVVWLPYGVEGDETDGHVDNICAFVAENTVVLSWTDEGEQGERCRKNLNVLEKSGLKVIKIPFPKNPVCFTEFEVAGFDPEDGEDVREAGEKLAASYVNFYVCNSSVLVPQFGDENDKTALEILGAAFPDRKIVPVPARNILTGGGDIHCITQQIPLKLR